MRLRYLALLLLLTCSSALGNCAALSDDTEKAERANARAEASLAKRDPEYAKAAKASLAGLCALLEGADKLELLRLHPSPVEKGKKAARPTFHRYEIIRQVTLGEAARRKELVQFLGGAFRWSPFLQAACFRPRHGVRATKGPRTIDLVICFECGRVQVYDGKQYQGTITVFAKNHDVVERLLKDAEKRPADTPK